MKRQLLIIILFNLIHFSSNAQWNRISSNDTTFYYGGAWFLNNDTGFVSGSQTINPHDPIVLRTKNGGTTWDTTIISGGGWYPSIKFVNDSVGYMGGQDGHIFKTFDMGNTWQWGGSCDGWDNMADMFFKTIDTGFIYNLFGYLFKYDTIPTWALSNCTYVGAYTWGHYYSYSGSLRFLDSQNGYMAGSLGNFVRTFDGGNTWQAFNGDSSLNVLGAWMSDMNHGVMVGANGMVSVTNNGGVSWSAPVSISPYCITDVSFVNNQKGYAVGGKDPCWLPALPEKGIIWKTSDGGYTWTVDDSSWNESIWAIFIVSDSLAYAVGDRGLILKNSNLNSIPEVTNSGSIISISPNPAINQLLVQSNKSSIESIEIYDALGKQVYNSAFNIQNSELSIDVSQWHAGIYFVKVQAGEKMAVRKVVKM